MSSLESQLDDLEHTLKASSGVESDNEKQKEHSGKSASATRLAMVRQAAMDMSPEEKKEARKAFDDDNDENKKKDARKASDHDYDDDKKKDARRANDDDYDDEKKKDARRIASDHEDDKDKKIASLTAKLNFHISKPIIDEMLTARVRSGMPQSQIDDFKKSLYGKTIDEIRQRYDEDRPLFARNNRLLSATVSNDTYSHYSYDGNNNDARPVPFIDGSNASADLSRPLDASSSAGDSDMTLEEMFK